MKTTVMEFLAQHLLPKFLNRANESFVFTSLSSENIRMIAGIQINLPVRRFANRQLKLAVTDAAIDLIGEAVPWSLPAIECRLNCLAARKSDLSGCKSFRPNIFSLVAE